MTVNLTDRITRGITKSLRMKALATDWRDSTGRTVRRGDRVVWSDPRTKRRLKGRIVGSDRLGDPIIQFSPGQGYAIGRSRFSVPARQLVKK